MVDESISISCKTWTKTVENISKMGYSDGVVDGQSSTFQSSFDLGYEQGFSLGLKLGFKEAETLHIENVNDLESSNVENVNCQICFNGGSSNENVVNLYNKQKENNDSYFKKPNEIKRILNL